MNEKRKQFYYTIGRYSTTEGIVKPEIIKQRIDCTV